MNAASESSQPSSASTRRHAPSLRAEPSCATASTCSSRARCATLSDTRPVTMATFDAGLAQQRHAEPVLDVVALELEGNDAVSVLPRPEIHATIGENAVHVEADDADATRQLRIDHRRGEANRWQGVSGAAGHERIRPQMSTARSHEGGQGVERQHVRAVARGVVGIGVRLEEEPVRRRLRSPRA